MKNIKKYRLGIQILFLVLTIVGFFTNFKVAMIVIMGLTVLAGVFYCGWICPYGFIQDLSSRSGELLGIKKRKMPKAIQKILVYSRYIIFAFVTLIATNFIFSIMSFDPRVNFGNLLLGNVGTIGVIAVMCFFVVISLFFERPFCNYLCYEGAKYGGMSSFKLFTIKRKESSCVNCKKCDKTCPMNIEVSKCSNLRSPQCINCFQCVSSCPVKGTLSYGRVNMSTKEKKRYLAMSSVLLVLITAFIVYNIFNGTNPLSAKSKYNSTNETTVTQTSPSTSKESKTITGDSSKNLGDAAGIADGVYTGEGRGFRGNITAQVTVKNQQITSVEVVQYNDDFKWFNRANSVIPDSIVQSQSTDVDVVSGATYSSRGIKDAVKDALNKAK